MSKIKLKHSSGNSMSIGAPATNPASDLELKLPATVGTAGQALVNSSTAGTLEFATVVKSGVNTVSTAGDVGYEFRNTNTTAGFGFKIKGGGTDSERYILRCDDAAGNERARINADGDVMIGVSSYGATGGVSVSPNHDDGAPRMIFNRANTSAWSDVILFQNNSGTKGRISHNDSEVDYYSASDYRLKENDVAITDGITRVKQLRPIKFNWKVKDASETQDGFFAHEVQSVVPNAVDGVKDAVDDDGNVIPQMFEASKIIPVLTAALQEAITKIETLETKVAALEAA